MRNLMLILCLCVALPILAQEADLESDDQQLDGKVIDVQNLEEAGTQAEETQSPVAQQSSAKKKKKKDGEKPDASQVEGGDTYNFYFQKGEGPGSVNQGGAQKTESEPAPQTRAPAPKEDEDTFARFEGHLGMAMTPTSSGSGLILGGQFNATRSFGLQVHLISLRLDDGNSSNSFGAGGSRDESTESTSSGGSFGISYAPFMINEGKVPVRIAFIGGVMFMKTEHETTINTFGAGGSHDTTTTTSESKTMAFAGLAGTAKVAKNFAVVGYGKLTSDTDYSQIGISAAWLF